MNKEAFIPDFPKYPELTNELIKECRERCSYGPIAFDYYRCTAQVVVYIANIKAQSAALAKLPLQQLHVFRGLLSRIARLMRAIGRLGHKLQDREAIIILSRSVTESSLRLMWLVREDTETRVKLFVESGLQAEVELKELIDKNVAARGHEIPLESRILRSIDKTANAGGLKIEEVRKKIKLPDLNSMMRNIDMADMYLALQTMPSSSVHGNWADLYLHFLTENNGELVPLNSESKVDDVIYLGQSMVVLLGLTYYIKHLITDEGLKSAFGQYLGEAHDTVLFMIKDSGNDDFVKAQSHLREAV